MPAPAVQDIFVPSILFIEPVQYWGAAPSLPKTWAWHRVCSEATQFSMSGRLRPAILSSDIVIRNLGVERLPDYFLMSLHMVSIPAILLDFISGSSGDSGSEFDSASSSGDTVYRSPSPPDYAYALGPPILSTTAQEEKLYFVQSPASSPAASPLQESSSSYSDVSMHFDSGDLPVRDQEAAHTSAPVASNVSTAALEDLKSYFSQRIDESTYELRSKVNAVEFNVRGDLVKQQAWLRQMFQNACDILERQSKQMNDLKKGLMAPVGTIFQDLIDIKKNQRAQEAKLNALDGQVAALRNDQLEFQNRISADLLSLSTQFADIVEFIRGKKGESGSSSRPPPVRVERRPLPTPQSPRDVAGGSSAVRIPTFPRTTGTFAELVEQARRHLLESGLVISVEEAAERIRQADFQESDRFQRERERAGREKRSSSSRRRRGF
ncbi:Tousled-like kinase [Dorcoceras hygrometricum]|nr:Tousled-like kinase [Dorcoceras hygrometricum]